MTTIRGDLSTGASRRQNLDASLNAGSSSSQLESTPTPGGAYRVRSGDTLSAIAKQAYGDASRWRDIAEANPGRVTADGHIRAGEVLTIPNAAADRVQTGAPGADAQRVLGTASGGAASGSAASGSTPARGDPALQQDLARQLTAARLGAPGAAVAPSAGEAEKPAEEENAAKTKLGQGKSGYKKEQKTDVRSYTKKSSRSFSRKDGWLDDKKDAADEAKDKPKVTSDWSAKATVAGVSWTDRGAVAQAGDMEGEGKDLLGGAVNAKGQVHALGYQTAASANAGIDLKNKSIAGDASFRAEGHLVGAEGQLQSQKYGNDAIHGQTTVKGKAYVGAEATGNVGVSVSKKGAKASAGIDAFAGAKASVEVKQSVGVAGHDVGSVGAVGEVYAGVGAKLKGEVGFEEGRFKVSGEVGAALGVGAGVKVNVDVDVVGTALAVRDGAVATGEAIADGAAYVGDKVSDGIDAASNAVSQATEAAASRVKGAFDAATDFFW